MTKEEFKAFRKNSGLSYDALAEIFGVARPTIYHWEQRGTPAKGAARNHVERILLMKFGIHPAPDPNRTADPN